MTDEIIDFTPEEKAALAAAIEFEEVEAAKFKEALEYFKEYGVYQGSFGLVEEFFEDNMVNSHLGYVDIEYHPEIKPSYGLSSLDGTFYRIKMTEEVKTLNEGLASLTFGKCYEEGDDDDRLDYLVWQVEEFEDCFHGHLLLPMKDGRYWLTYYSL